MRVRNKFIKILFILAIFFSTTTIPFDIASQQEFARNPKTIQIILDLSKLDQQASGRTMELGLIKFAELGHVVQSLNTDYELLGGKNGLTFSPDGSMLVTGSMNEGVQIMKK